MPSLLTLAFFAFLFAGSAVVLLAPTGAMVRARGVVVALRPVGDFDAECPEVEIDVMVRRPDGGQFATRHTVRVPGSSLDRFVPGSVVDIFYHPGDDASAAVWVPTAR
ncbi:hypothetical protein ACNUDN_13705 [Mycobacterium sp. smrl_JER01]|uniref:hypothetical protein n=1 Tax=Mycobacterium sp. smrl_JER01 TaxID=3402633 RepID=UPI003ACA897E